MSFWGQASAQALVHRHLAVGDGQGAEGAGLHAGAGTDAAVLALVGGEAGLHGRLTGGVDLQTGLARGAAAAAHESGQGLGLHRLPAKQGGDGVQSFLIACGTSVGVGAFRDGLGALLAACESAAAATGTVTAGKQLQDLAGKIFCLHTSITSFDFARARRTGRGTAHYLSKGLVIPKPLWSTQNGMSTHNPAFFMVIFYFLRKWEGIFIELATKDY